MRKSLSLDNVAIASAHLREPAEDGEQDGRRDDGLLYTVDVEETDGGHLMEQKDEEEDEGEDFSGQRQSEGPSPGCAEKAPVIEVPVIRFQEVVSARGGPNLAASFSTLPRPLSRHRNISRSLVPKMRRMFEKARSCDPDLPPQLKLTVPGSEAAAEASSSLAALSPPLIRPASHQDGTESARSSFVLLGPGGHGSGSGSGRSESSLADSSLTLGEGSPVLQDRKSRGFVNKCVTKVKSFMGKSQDRL
jgi:hypothetical protein